MFYHNLSSFLTLFQNIISTSTGLISVHILYGAVKVVIWQGC